jgi:uncharacterized repeat protein (TIGR01451 family)
VIGSPVPPPLIHIIKKALPVILPPGGGSVAYTYSVTNPGTVTLDNVSVADDRCGSVTRVSGDVNSNNLLEISEEWVYACQQNLTATTINTATAQGSGNGLTATDVSVASVTVSPALVVPAPKLPNTGFAPQDNAFSWFAVFAGFVFSVVGLLAFVQWKRLS